MATEADFEYVQALGGGAAANQDILDIVNQVDGIYEAHLTISIRVVFQRAWEADNDPYTETDFDQLARQLRANHDTSFAPGTTPARDFVRLWTGREIDGGIVGAAYLSVLCADPAFSYGFSQFLDAAFSAAERVTLSAHEFGHNFGAEHATEQNGPDCSLSIMYPFINPSHDFCQFSREQITGHVINQGSCLTRLQFDAAEYSVDEATTAVALTVTRTGDTAPPFTLTV